MRYRYHPAQLQVHYQQEGVQHLEEDSQWAVEENLTSLQVHIKHNRHNNQDRHKDNKQHSHNRDNQDSHKNNCREQTPHPPLQK